MEYIRRYIRLYPADKLCLIGGAAASIWIESSLKQHIPIKDYDLLLNTRVNVTELMNRWRQLFPTAIIQHEFGIITIIDSAVTFDIFINERTIPRHSIIEDVPIMNYVSLIQTHLWSIRNCMEDIVYMEIKDDPELEDVRDKYQRLKQRLKLLKQIHNHQD